MPRLPRLSSSNTGLTSQVAAQHPLEAAGRVAGGRLDLDHVGAPVGQDAGGAGAGDPHAQLDDPDALEGPGGFGGSVGVRHLATLAQDQHPGAAVVSTVRPMRHFVTYPLVAHPSNPELMAKAAIVRFATRAEELGFDGVGFTDHPAPSHRWLQAGGHDALDPFVALGLVAAVTERVRLVPNILVLPYRNPFLVAKAAATLDAAVGRPVRAGRGHGLPARRVPGPGRRLRRAEPAVRRGARGGQGHLVRRRVRLRGPSLHRPRADRQPQAGARPDLDRREQRSVPPTGGDRRRRLDAVRSVRHPGADGQDAGARDGRRPAADARPPLALRRRGRPRPRRRSTSRCSRSGARRPATPPSTRSRPSTRWARSPGSG